MIFSPAFLQVWKAPISTATTGYDWLLPTKCNALYPTVRVEKTKLGDTKNTSFNSLLIQGLSTQQNIYSKKSPSKGDTAQFSNWLLKLRIAFAIQLFQLMLLESLRDKHCELIWVIY